MKGEPRNLGRQCSKRWQDSSGEIPLHGAVGSAGFRRLHDYAAHRRAFTLTSTPRLVVDSRNAPPNYMPVDLPVKRTNPVPRRTLSEPFFYFDEANASVEPRAPDESTLACVRRLGTKDGVLLRCLLNRCWTRYDGYSKKRRDMAGSLEKGKHRQQMGVITELLVSEILDRLYARVEVEPRNESTGPRPDFRVRDDRGRTVIVEATNYMETSDEIHEREVLWESIVDAIRRIVVPLPAWVTVHPVGIPKAVRFGDQETSHVRSAVARAVRTGRAVSVPFERDFSIGIEADADSGSAGRESVAWFSYEDDGGVVDIAGKLHRITQKVREKATRYSAFPRPLVVVMNCPKAFLWYDEADEIEPLKDMVRGLPCDAVWLFCNLQPSNIGFCEHHLLENPDSRFGETDHLAPIREACGSPLYEVLGLGAIWNRVVARDRNRTPNPQVAAT